MARRRDDDDEGGGLRKKNKSDSIQVAWKGKTFEFPRGTRADEALSFIATFSKHTQQDRLVMVAEEDDKVKVYGKDAVLTEDLKYSVSTYGVHKPPVKLPRRFGAGHAVDPEGFYFVEPDVGEFLQGLQRGKYCVLCARRQSGKTTTAKVVMEQLSREGDVFPVYIGGLEMSAKHFSLSQMWSYFWDCLHRSRPDLFEKRPETLPYCLSIHFKALFEKATLHVPVALIMDEADSLLLLSSECLDDFFHAIRELKQNRARYSLRSFALIGVETVKDLLEAHYNKRYAQAGGSYVPSSMHSPLSPFPHDHSISPSEFDVADITNLLQQANSEHGGILNDVSEIAASIMDQTLGHKGLVGTCLAYLMQEQAYGYKAWLELSDSYKLGTFVFGQATYCRILHSFRQQVSASQEQFDLLVGILQSGGREYIKADLSMIRSLLADGVLAVKEETEEGVCFVDLSSPLLRTAILRKCVITDQEVERPPTTTSVDRKWVVVQAIKTLDGDLISTPECLNSDGRSSSEYVHQFLFMCRVKTILRQAYPHIQCFVLPEVKEKQVPGRKRRQLRLDTLVRDGPNCARMGFELVVDASMKSAEEHERRAREYCEQHSAQVFLLNFTKDKRAILIQPMSDGVYSMSVQFNSADKTALLQCLDVHGHFEESRVHLTKWTGLLSFQDLV